MKNGFLILITCLLTGNALQDFTSAQTSMIGTMPTRRQEEGAPLVLGQMSYTIRPAESPRTYREHDLVMVVVKRKWSSLTEGELERKRKMRSDYGITKWISFDGLGFKSANFEGGAPAVGAEIDSQFKNKGSIVRHDTLEFKITCQITSIQENGVLFLEGTDSQTLAEEGKKIYFSGYVSPQEIQPDNSVLCERIFFPQILEIPSGSVYNSYRPNWGQKAIDRYSPF